MMRLVVLLLLMVPTAMGAINGPRDYDADYGFSDPLEDDFINVVSGSLEADLGRSTGPYGFFDVDGFSIQDLDLVCWGSPNQLPGIMGAQAKGQDTQCIEGSGVRVDVSDGSNVALNFARRADAAYEAEHALSIFLKQRGDDLNGLNLNQSILAPAVDGSMSFESVGAFSFSTWKTMPFVFNALVPTSESTSITIVGDTIQTVDGKDEWVTFFGAPRIAPFLSDFVVLPFNDESVAEFGVADVEAARQGLDLARVEQVFKLLQGASSEPETGASEDIGENPLADSMSEVLNSALIRVPSSPSVDAEAAKEEVAIVLFQDLMVANTGGDLAWDGDAAFQYQSGEIAGSTELHGVWYFQLPWWGWFIWLAAIGVFIARLVVKPEKHHHRWDQYRWVGWVAGAAMFVLVFILWDFEMRSVWGTSIMSTGTVGTAFWITFGIQLATMFLVLGVLGWPLGILIKNSLLLSKQGTFMGLGKPISVLIAFLLGATLFLAYLELIISEAVAQI